MHLDAQRSRCRGVDSRNGTLQIPQFIAASYGKILSWGWGSYPTPIAPPMQIVMSPIIYMHGLQLQWHGYDVHTFDITLFTSTR